ncbi:MAG: cyclase family protein [Phototrophicaceae bacterium]
MTIYDITRTTQMGRTAEWPGDVPFSFQRTAQMAEGASVNLTAITLSPHVGTHADAHYHYSDDGEHPDQMPLVPFIGRARVISIPRERGAFTVEELGERVRGAERLLIHTPHSESDLSIFPLEFPYFAAAAADWLGACGVQLIGVDVPSVDHLTSKDLIGHHTLYRHRIVIVESLTLAGVPDGDYELIALPLKIADVCATPVRAILRDLR